MPVISSGYNKLRRFHLSVESDLHLLWPCITALNDRLKKTTRANLSKPKSIVARSHAVSRVFFSVPWICFEFWFFIPCLCTLFIFYKNMFYKNIEAEICEILRLF